MFTRGRCDFFQFFYEFLCVFAIFVFFSETAGWILFKPGGDVAWCCILHIGMTRYRVGCQGFNLCKLTCKLVWLPSSILHLKAQPSIGNLRNYTCKAANRCLCLSSSTCLEVQDTTLGWVSTKFVHEVVLRSFSVFFMNFLLSVMIGKHAYQWESYSINMTNVNFRLLLKNCQPDSLQTWWGCTLGG